MSARIHSSFISTSTASYWSGRRTWAGPNRLVFLLRFGVFAILCMTWLLSVCGDDDMLGRTPSHHRYGSHFNFQLNSAHSLVKTVEWLDVLELIALNPHLDSLWGKTLFPLNG